MMSNVSVVFAQTFNDVPTDAWYYDYVEQLVNDGVIDVNDNFRPNDALNRAELVKDRYYSGRRLSRIRSSSYTNI